MKFDPLTFQARIMPYYKKVPAILTPDGIEIPLDRTKVSENAIIRVTGAACSHTGIQVVVINPRRLQQSAHDFSFEIGKQSFTRLALQTLGVAEAAWYIRKAAGFASGVIAGAALSIFLDPAETAHEEVFVKHVGRYPVKFLIHGKVYK